MASDPSLTISVHENLEGLEALRPEWETLLAEYPQATIFSTYEWLASWWRAFGRQDRLLVLAFRDATGALVALAPLAITAHRSFAFRSRRLRFMGDGSYDSDNLDFPVKPGFENQFADALLHFLKSRSRRWDFAELNTMPPQSLAANVLRQALAQRRWTEIEKQRPASAIALPATWEDYLAQLSSEDRKNLVRYTRRLEKRYRV